VGAGEDRRIEADRPERPGTAQRDAEMAAESERAEREEGQP
jgi:hypothetical protein